MAKIKSINQLEIIGYFLDTKWLNQIKVLKIPSEEPILGLLCNNNLGKVIALHSHWLLCYQLFP